MFASLLLSVRRNACIEADPVNPGAHAAFSTELCKSFPKVYKDVLEQVGDLLLILREHVADGIYRPFMFSYDLRKIEFQ